MTEKQLQQFKSLYATVFGAYIEDDGYEIKTKSLKDRLDDLEKDLDLRVDQEDKIKRIVQELEERIDHLEKTKFKTTETVILSSKIDLIINDLERLDKSNQKLKNKFKRLKQLL